MATVVFAGTTLWNDAQTGFGVLRFNQSPPVVRYGYEDLPRGTGRIAKNLGTNPGQSVVVLQYRVTTGEEATLRNTLNGVVSLFGTLQVRGVSYTNHVLERFEFDTGPPILEGSITKRLVSVSILFQRLR